MNEDVLKMIDTLHARLDDVREAVESLPSEAPEYATKLDKVDDTLYLLQVEIEKIASGEAPAQDAPQQKEEASEEEGKEIITDEMKDNLKEAGRAMMDVARDGKEIVGELTGTMNEFKDAFSFIKKR